ncbi:hypothetical protein D3C87_1769360 [compost metagenome]
MKDCATISSATDQAPIDFYEAECKAFGGFRFFIKGSDLRYGPQLSYLGTDIELDRPMGFHDFADSSVEWIYQRESDEEGSGKITWKGLIYSLSATDGEGEPVISFYGIRLQEEKSCLVAVVSDADLAKQSILDPNSACK